MPKIIVVYHCLFFMGEPPELLPQSLDIVEEQMRLMKESGLEDAADEIHIGVNGGEESKDFRSLLPQKANVVYHGLQCRNELRTILMIENLAKENPNCVLNYWHSKGVSHPPDSPYGINVSRPWRKVMEHYLIRHWKHCVAELENGYEVVGVRWLTGMGWDKSQHYFAGTFWWARSNFLATLPSVTVRQRIKDSGIDSIESRYEAEITLGNGPRLPRQFSYLPEGGYGHP
jgi:hypothetical protein